MNTVIKLIAASGFVAASVAPVFAQAVVGDPMTTSCADFATQDEAGKMSLAMQLDAYTAMTDANKTTIEAMTEEEKAALIADAEAARAAMTPEQMEAATAAAETTMMTITRNCQANPALVVVDAMDAEM